MSSCNNEGLERATATQKLPSGKPSHYSMVGEVDDPWSRLASLKVFKPASETASLDLVDIVHSPSQQCEKITRTFENSQELEDYICHSSIKDGLRFM